MKSGISKNSELLEKEIDKKGEILLGE